LPGIIDWSIESHLVCRGLFRGRGVLHRDISTGNLLWNESKSVPNEGTAQVPPVFIEHLLDPRHVALPVSPELVSTHLLNSEPKHRSSITLIDFDHAEVYTSKKRVTDVVVSPISYYSCSFSVTGGQGTPNFMARAVHKGCPLSAPESFPASPVLRRDATSVYKRCYPDRFKLFGNKEKWPTKVAEGN